MTKNRFDLEQDLLRIQDICQDIDLFLEQYLDGPKALTEDEVANLVYGIRSVLQLRSEKAWDTFCQVFKVDEYKPEPIDSSYPDGDGYWQDPKEHVA